MLAAGPEQAPAWEQAVVPGLVRAPEQVQEPVQASVQEQALALAQEQVQEPVVKG